jgi:hypothetical protein
MDSFKVIDEGAGIISVDAHSRLVRKPLASAMCAEVDKVVANAGYDEFKILMNMSAMSKGTPAAGLYVLRSMKKYPLRATAMYGANSFMRGMATTVMGLARFGNFKIFDGEATARTWLERADGAAPPSPTTSGPSGMKRIAVPVGALLTGLVLLRAKRRKRRVIPLSHD